MKINTYDIIGFQYMLQHDNKPNKIQNILVGVLDVGRLSLSVDFPDINNETDV